MTEQTETTETAETAETATGPVPVVDRRELMLAWLEADNTARDAIEKLSDLGAAIQAQQDRIATADKQQAVFLAALIEDLTADQTPTE